VVTTQNLDAVVDHLPLKDTLTRMEVEGDRMVVEEDVAGDEEEDEEEVVMEAILTTIINMTGPITEVLMTHISMAPPHLAIMRTDPALEDTAMTAADMAVATKVRNLRLQHFLIFVPRGTL
jgi:hypothetical protein